MSIRTTVGLDDDVAERVKHVSKARGTSFRATLNDLLRMALLNMHRDSQRRKLEIKPVRMGYKPGLNYDCVESLIEYGEGPQHK